MTAGNRIRYFFVAFDVDPRKDRFAFERICHILFAGVCKRTVIFAKMASKTPLFIYIDSFHDVTSFSRVGYTEYLQLLVGKSDTSEHQSVATEGFD